MKKIIYVLVTALAVCVAFSSCKKAPSSLVGLTYTGSGVSPVKTINLVFKDKDDALWTDIYETGGSQTTEFEYTYRNPNITLIDDETETFVLPGVVDETGITFTKDGKSLRLTRI